MPDKLTMNLDERIKAAAAEIDPSSVHLIESIIRKHVAPAETPTIEACPWCGSKAKAGIYDFVICRNNDCLAAGPRRCGNAPAAIAEWNRVARAVRESKAAQPQPATTEPELPVCCLCGRKPVRREANGLVACPAITVEQCPLTGEYTDKQWTDLHAPNRLTLPLKLTSMADFRLWPVEIGHGGSISAIFDNHLDASQHATEYEGRRVLDPIPVTVRVKP